MSFPLATVVTHLDIPVQQSTRTSSFIEVCTPGWSVHQALISSILLNPMEVVRGYLALPTSLLLHYFFWFFSSCSSFINEKLWYKELNKYCSCCDEMRAYIWEQIRLRNHQQWWRGASISSTVTGSLSWADGIEEQQRTTSSTREPTFTIWQRTSAL